MHSIAAATRLAQSRSTPNSRAVANTSSGRRRLPPPIAACRIARYRSARGSSGTASRASRRRSTSAPTWVSAACNDREAAGTRSAGRKGLGAGGAAFAVEPDRLDPRLGGVEPVGAAAAQLVAALVQADRLVERRIAAFEPRDDCLELLQRVLERQ